MAKRPQERKTEVGASDTNAPSADTPKRPKRLPEPPVPNVVPRLLSVNGAAWYLGVSRDAVLALLNTGAVSQVILPVQEHRTVKAPVPGELRRLLFDTDELDALIPAWRSKRRAQ